MACVYCKDYEVKIKMVQEQWLQLRVKFFGIIKWKLSFSGGEDKNFVGGFLQVGGGAGGGEGTEQISEYWGTPPTYPNPG